MFIFIAGVVLGAVPQYMKLILLANSDGISMTSLVRDHLRLYQGCHIRLR